MAAPSRPSRPPLPLAPAPGGMNVDYEERVDFARLRGYGHAVGCMEWRGMAGKWKRTPGPAQTRALDKDVTRSGC